MKVNINGEDTDLVGLVRFVSSLIVHCYECGSRVSKYDPGHSMGRHDDCNNPTDGRRVERNRRR